MDNHQVFIGYYNSKKYWAGGALDLSDRDLVTNFYKSMSEIVFSYEENDYNLKVCRDKAKKTL